MNAFLCAGASVSRKQILSLIYLSFVKFHLLTQGKAFKNGSFSALLGATSQKDCVCAAWRESFCGAVGLQLTRALCWCCKGKLRKAFNAGKGEQSKDFFWRHHCLWKEHIGKERILQGNQLGSVAVC